MGEPVTEMKSDLEAMYRAGRVDIPEQAATLSHTTAQLRDVLDTFNQQSALAGDPAVMTSMLHVGQAVYDVMRRAVITLDNCAAAVVATADDFRATDERAAADYAKMSRGLKTPVPPVTPPAPLPHLEDPGATTTSDSGSPQPGRPRPPVEVPVESTPEPVPLGQDAQTRDQQETRSQTESGRAR